MSFLDSLFGTKKQKQMPEWEPTHRAVLETTYGDLKRAFGRGKKDDDFGYTFWDICADELEDRDLLDEDDCAQVSNRDPRYAGSAKERGPRKSVEDQERFYILASSKRMLDAVADSANASVFQRGTVR